MEFFQGDLFAAASGAFDIIVSNPPYIPDDVYPLLPAGIREFEPREALIAGPDGTDFHRRIIREGAHRLKAGGWIFLEIGEGQQGLVEALFREAGCYDDDLLPEGLWRDRPGCGGQEKRRSERWTRW